MKSLITYLNEKLSIHDKVMASIKIDCTLTTDLDTAIKTVLTSLAPNRNISVLNSLSIHGNVLMNPGNIANILTDFKDFKTTKYQAVLEIAAKASDLVTVERSLSSLNSSNPGFEVKIKYSK